MLTKVLLLLLPAAASAFTQRSSISMSFGVKPPAGAKLYTDELGAQKPLGYFDPIGLVTNVDQERFDRLRGVEIKHGRVAMLAFLGHLTTSAGIYLPGYISKSNDLLFSDVKPGLAAFENLPPLATFQIILFVGFLEINVMRDVTGLSEFPGDFRNGALDYGWDKFTPEEQYQKRAIELNNGRAAMMGILGLMAHEAVQAKAGDAIAPYIIS